MSIAEMDVGGQNANNSSDFVRKLYKYDAAYGQA